MSGRKEYKDVLYLIDFGLSKKYVDPKTGKHVKFVNNRRLNGTAKYASIHALEGYETSRRDDLEELCYVLIYFLNGYLPWERVKNKNKQEKYKMILNMKKKMSELNLVGDKNNKEFIEFVNYCRKLEFEEKPNYEYLRGLMVNCITKNNKSVDNFYNIDIYKNPLFLSQDKKKKKSNNEYYLQNLSQNISVKNTRCNSTNRLNINMRNNKLIPNGNIQNLENKENNDNDNKILDESKKNYLGYLDKNIRHYSSFKNNGIKDFARLNNLKNRHPHPYPHPYPQLNNSNYSNYAIINKNQTAFRHQSKINNNAKCTSFDNKKYGRTRFNFIKRSLGIEQKKSEINKNDTNEILKMKKNISDNNDNNDNNNNKNDNNNNNNDDGCIIL